MKVFLDNAATTPMDPEVIEAMIPVMREKFGNPSSTHGFGREVKGLIETARKSIAGYLNCAASEIIFTSGGTEADNMAIRCGILDHQIKHAISTPIEHHAVGHTLEAMEKEGLIKLSYVRLDEKGHVDLDHLEELLANNSRSFVSLMHANNEIGTLLPIKTVSEICRKHDAIFHSDTVQSMAHYKFDVSDLYVHFLTCSAHKFHGPKGTGFLYVNKNVNVCPLIHGGSQERNLRGGTENVLGIVGLSKAMEVAHRDMDEHQNHVQGLKSYMIKELEANIPGVEFNGDAKGESLYTVLSVSFPPFDRGSMMLFNLDINGIACSGGSACTSGSNAGSHVLRGIGANMNRPTVRFSFSRFNTKEEIDYAISKLKEMFAVPA